MSISSQTKHIAAMAGIATNESLITQMRHLMPKKHPQRARQTRRGRDAVVLGRAETEHFIELQHDTITEQSLLRQWQ